MPNIKRIRIDDGCKLVDNHFKVETFLAGLFSKFLLSLKLLFAALQLLQIVLILFGKCLIWKSLIGVSFCNHLPWGQVLVLLILEFLWKVSLDSLEKEFVLNETLTKSDAAHLFFCQRVCVSSVNSLQYNWTSKDSLPNVSGCIWMI